MLVESFDLICQMGPTDFCDPDLRIGTLVLVEAMKALREKAGVAE